MRMLLIDNYDSFTYNLFQLLAEVNGSEPVVVRNDEASWEELVGEGFEAVVLSPGPGRPDREADFGVCAAAVASGRLPLLGVCLGHQGIGLACGGRVERAPEPVHGRLTSVVHSGSSLFAGIPPRFEVVRYHSLCLARPLPPGLEELARAEDGVVMAVAHRTRPQWGVQFHPESVATEYGHRLLENFRDLAGGLSATRHRPAPSPSVPTAEPTAEGEGIELRWRRLEWTVDTETAFTALYGESGDAFWLDGAGTRFSFMGDAGGPLAARVTYDVEAREVTVARTGGRGETAVEVRAETIFDYLDRELRRLRPSVADLPFEFGCGFAGYLGYEAKADCGGEHAHGSPLPDAAFVFADRMLAFDRELGSLYLLCLHRDGEGAGAEAWIESTARRLAAAGDFPEAGFQEEPPDGLVRDLRAPELAVGEEDLARSRERYLDDIAECKRLLGEGEAYEVCLTNSVGATVESNPLDLYRRLRRVNPAPFSAYLRFGDLAVLSSSPERFLRVDGEGAVESKPIKGTCRRGSTPVEDAQLAASLRADPKSRAENLMIADLLRNDLGSVCEVGSIEVPSLIEVESFETVHHLVSTVRGRLRAGLSAVDCIRATFPGGSMTGAPKRRAMEIIDQLEGAPRGIYSGAIGYLGLGGGCDLSIAIRTIVLEGSQASIGVGGAILTRSDPEQEYREALLKAVGPIWAIAAADAPALR